LYTGLSTVANLMAARHTLFRDTVLEGAIYFGRTLGEEVKHRKVVEEIIDFLEMENIRHDEVGLLGLSAVCEKKSYKDIKHYKRRKRWLG